MLDSLMNLQLVAPVGLFNSIVSRTEPSMSQDLLESLPHNVFAFGKYMDGWHKPKIS